MSFLVTRATAVALLLTALSSAAAPTTHEDSGDLGRKVDQIFAAYDRPDSPGCGLGVISDGQFVYKRSYGAGNLELGVPLTSASVFYMASVSKQFTAASVILAAEQGYLSLDDGVRKYIPELPSYANAITLRQMLHHTSGLRDLYDLMLIAGRNVGDIHPTSELLNLISRQEALNFMPGDEFLYSNTNYILMSIVIQRATGKPLSRFADENIFKPLGMTHTRFYDDNTVVVPGRVAAYEPGKDGGFQVDWSTTFEKVGDGGLMSSIDDLLQWDRNFYANKLGKGTLLREIQTPGVLNNGKQIEYALGLVMSTYRGLPIVEHRGSLFGYRTELLRFPQKKFSVICLCNLGTSNPRSLAYQIADIYLEGQFAPDHPATATVAVDPQPFSGYYRNVESHSLLEVAVAEGNLTVYGQHLKPFGPGKFAASGGLEVNFAPGTSMRMTITAADTIPQTFERFQTHRRPPEDLTQYAGVYTNRELKATYRFAVKNGVLTLSTNWQDPWILDPSVGDDFQGPSGTSIVFQRDTSGNINSCDVVGDRVRSMRFVRTTK
jgi:CubicO group peptidase (beta-lactamase class C family)